MTVGLKICGVTDPDDARLCAQPGVSAIGINFWSGSKRVVDPVQGRAIAQAAPSLLRVGVFVDEAPAVVAEIATQVGLDAIQPHGDADPRPYAALGFPWIWVIRTPIDPNALVVPEPVPQWVLVDAPTPHFGGQGVVADWGWAARVVAALAPLPVWLAGGLSPDNAAASIEAVGPAGLDVASGAELATTSPPRKDPDAVAALAAICLRLKA